MKRWKRAAGIFEIDEWKQNCHRLSVSFTSITEIILHLLRCWLQTLFVPRMRGAFYNSFYFLSPFISLHPFLYCLIRWNFRFCWERNLKKKDWARLNKHLEPPKLALNSTWEIQSPLILILSQQIDKCIGCSHPCRRYVSFRTSKETNIRDRDYVRDRILSQDIRR